jgi:ribosomal peptide maturation radical SAM protein 1
MTAVTAAASGTGRAPDAPPRAGFRTALVTMPFGSARAPSIQLGLLAAICEQAGFPVDTRYPNLELAAELGVERYERLCEHRGHMTGDWLFAPAAFGADAVGSAGRFLERFPSERDWAGTLGGGASFLTRLRSRILPAYIDRIAAEGDWGRYAVVGFSSTFQQNVASLALARRLKARLPRVLIVFGGANVDGDMGVELLRAFEWVDLVVCGEGDVALPALLTAVGAGTDPAGIPGVLTRGPGGVVTGTQAPPTGALDDLPTPDYDGYFRQARELGLEDELAPHVRIPVESSRGCWWGAKHHCTFCGLNGLGMGYRAKSPERVLRELDDLSAAHGGTSFDAVDNILSLDYFDTLFAGIADAKLDFRFFYEVKANMGREKIRKLAHGGVEVLQPGIESLSTHVLKLMRKGSTMLQNVLCLKWCSYYRIGAAWNLLHGFPGELEEDYVAQLAVLKAITHLQPPKGFDRIWLERFSPYYTEADAFGVRGVRPSASYAEVYPGHVALDRLAYFFDYEMPGALGEAARGTPPARILDETARFVAHWQELWRRPVRPSLTFRRIPRGVLVDRDDGTGARRTTTLTGAPAEMFLCCGDRPQAVRTVTAHLLETTGEAFAPEDVRETLAAFCDAGLMVGEGDRFLSLPLPANRHW